MSMSTHQTTPQGGTWHSESELREYVRRAEKFPDRKGTLVSDLNLIWDRHLLLCDTESDVLSEKRGSQVSHFDRPSDRSNIKEDCHRESERLLRGLSRFAG